MMRVSEAAKALQTNYLGEDRVFFSVGTDSRVIEKNQLFVALKGEKFDGHLYVSQALTDGAAAVMVNRADTDNTLVSALVVEDTYQALGALAAYWRQKFSIPVLAVTGSNGKTTVKEMLASILRAATKLEKTETEQTVLATTGNLNNHIGLPLTLLKLRSTHQFAVVEMGMNHRGEIRYLTQIAKPNVVIINNAGNAHLGELGSYAAIAEAKGEIIEGLAEGGVVVLNADDQFFPLWKKLAQGKKVTSFGFGASSDVNACYQLNADSSDILLKIAGDETAVRIPSPGLHNVMNALAASAAASVLGLPIQAIQQGLENYQNAKGRLQVFAGVHGARVIDDTYNANPMSMKAAIDVLKTQTGQKILVLGDMGELGNDAAAMHEEIGEYAKKAQIDLLFVLGDLSVNIVRGFGHGATHYAALDVLVSDVISHMQADTTVLVKGSRFMAMERVVKEIVATGKQ